MIRTAALRVMVFVLCPLGVQATAGPTAALAERPAPADQAKILHQIRHKMGAYFGKVKGTTSRRTSHTRELDPKTDKLLTTKRAVVAFTHFLYGPPKIKVLSCKVDGKKADLDECERKGKQKAMLPIFDSKGASRYHVELTGRRTIRSVECHKLKVTPRQATDQHFKGHLYFSTRDLQLIMSEGTVADLPMALKSFYLKIHFKKLGEFAVVSDGYVDIHVRIPLLVNRRIISKFRADRHSYLKR